MKTGRSLISLAQELERQLATKQDMIVPSARMRCKTDAAGSCTLAIEESGGLANYAIAPLARRQLAEKLKIPFPYFERMRVSQSALLDDNVNTWLHSDPERRLIRTLDGQVRAILSDRYRRLDNYALAENVLPVLQQLPGAQVASVELTETKMYLKVVTPRRQVEIVPGDVVQAGVAITNSEVGHGMLSVQPLLYRLVCRNGLIAAERGLRKTHLGRILQADEDVITRFRSDTLVADDRAFFLKVRDVVEAAVSDMTFQDLATKMGNTRRVLLTGNPVNTVEVLGDRYALNETEREGVLRALVRDGELSGYGLLNAVTHYSQGVADYDRATELEAIGGKLIDLSVSEWRGLAHV